MIKNEKKIYWLIAVQRCKVARGYWRFSLPRWRRKFDGQVLLHRARFFVIRRRDVVDVVYGLVVFGRDLIGFDRGRSRGHAARGGVRVDFAHVEFAP